jgi:hypothetical protein
MRKRLNALALAVIAAGTADLALARPAHALIEEPKLSVYCCGVYDELGHLISRCCYRSGCQVNATGCVAV